MLTLAFIYLFFLTLAFKSGVIAPIFLMGKPQRREVIYSSLNSYKRCCCFLLHKYFLLLCCLNILLLKEVENAEYPLSQTYLLIGPEL